MRKVGVETCGPYTIVNELGSGDGWICFLGRDERGEVVLTVFTSGGDVVRQIIDLQQRAGAVSSHVARVIDHGTCEAGEWYATGAYPRSIAKLLEGRVELNRAWLLQILLAMTRGALAFKKACGRAHGNLQPHNVLLNRTPNIKETEIVIKDPAVDVVDSTDAEVRDLNAIGMTLYQLVRRREVEERAIILPLEISQEWRARFGKDADRWVALCNRLLDRSLSTETYTLEELEKALVALEPKAAVSRRQLAMAAAVVLCAAVAGLAVAWFRAQATLEVSSNLPGVKVVVKSTGKVLKTVTVQNQPVTVKVRKGTYVLEGEREEFRATNTVVVASRKQPAPLRFEYAVLNVQGVAVQDGTTNGLWTTNRYVMPGVEVRQMIAIEGYQPESVKETLAVGQTTNVVRLLQKTVPGNVRVEIEVLPVTARIQLRDSAGRVVAEDSRGIQKDLAPGRYQVVLQYEVVTVTNEVTVMASNPLIGGKKLSFEIPTGQLRLLAENGVTDVKARIWHGRREVGFTTDPAKYWPTGTWTFRLEAEGHEETNLVVSVSAGGTVTRTQRLIPVVAILEITSDPSGATFGTNEAQLTWKTPAEITVPPGKHTLYARHEDLGPISKSIEVGKGQVKVPLEFRYGKVKLSANLPNVRVSHPLNPAFRPLEMLSVLPLGPNRLTAVYGARLTNTLDVMVEPGAKQTPLAAVFPFDYGEVVFTNSLTGAEVYYQQQDKLVLAGIIRAGEPLKDISPRGTQVYKARASIDGAYKTNSWSLNVTSTGPYFVQADFKGPVNHRTSFGMELVWVEALGYYVGKYEVTQAEFQSVMGENPSRWKMSVTNPVDSVTFQRALEFCEKLNATDKLIPEAHKDYRYALPSFAQWKAFAGSAFTNASLAVLKTTNSLPVGLKSPNEHQLHDVRGNLLEWTLEGDPVGSSYESPGLFRTKEIIPSREYTDQKIGFRVILAPRQLAQK